MTLKLHPNHFQLTGNTVVLCSVTGKFVFRLMVMRLISRVHYTSYFGLRINTKIRLDINVLFPCLLPAIMLLVVCQIGEELVVEASLSRDFHRVLETMQV